MSDEKNASGSTTTAPGEITKSVPKDVVDATVVDATVGTTKQPNKFASKANKPGNEVVDEATATPAPAKAPDPGIIVPPPVAPTISISLAPIRAIIVDTHKRMIQYLGIVNPGVIRIVLEMLIEQEQKTIKLLSGSGIKIE